MRRISVKYAQPEMELAKPLFDKWGNMLLPIGAKLTERQLRLLPNKGVRELSIEDSRVDDVLWDPLIKPETQQEAVKAISDLLTINQKGGGIKSPKDPRMVSARLNIEKMSYMITQEVLTSVMGEPDLSGCQSIEDYHCIQPVQSTILAVMLAKEAGFNEGDMLSVAKAAMLQNIGYTFLPQEILRKETELSPEETLEFEKHPIYGAEILRQTGQTSPQIIEAVLQHEERWNGSGYPNKIRGWDISPFAQIIGIAHTYYDLVSARPWREPFKQMDAFEYIMAYGGELFDPEWVQVFSRRVPIYPSGVKVKLSTGEIGIISDANLGHIGRPMVRIISDSKGNDVSRPYDMDLSKPSYQDRLVIELLEI
ncbi:MAG: HD domain-containing protein [Dehalococcoidia bacterium]|nr:HD domain-containing protein [Dehalococcoidia bacterium]